MDRLDTRRPSSTSKTSSSVTLFKKEKKEKKKTTCDDLMLLSGLRFVFNLSTQVCVCVWWDSFRCTCMGSSSSHCPDTNRSPYSPMHQDATCTRGCYRTQKLKSFSVAVSNLFEKQTIHHIKIKKCNDAQTFKILWWRKLELVSPVICHPAALCKVSVLCKHASPHCL